ncbi:MAG: UvrD-helicase domain-containing protein [Gammaproteobacteria bacterium]|nr:UvrD-helicase domain-containing protein [Gammaproteobacteria bacterium]
MNNPAIADAAQRRQALDPARSFIVQAPAGSGKTSLLTQRYLTLLAQVTVPEEIVAITFTRKAAAEMRSRILEALRNARAAPQDNDYARETWELARAALDHDRRQGWDVLSHPARLRILTIDALCGSLARQMPVLSGFGAVPATADDATELYRLAARETLNALEKDESWSPAVERLLRHLDNHLAQVEDLLANMLARRDQWLRHVVSDAGREREMLEAALRNVISDALTDVMKAMPVAIGERIVELACFAASNLDEENTSSLRQWGDRASLPGNEIADVTAWHAIVDLLLTDKGTWRKKADKNIGFPAPSTAKDKESKALYQTRKQQLEELIAELERTDAEQPGEYLRARLADLRRLPAARYTEAQWQVLEALFDLLPVAAGHLKLIFGERGQVDFSEVAQRAAEALGNPDNPTDLALALDYRIKHLLVDEFQDTSFGQYQLLERLTAGWQAGDGRSLFVVGDPMQSIYRFREAEVGLFLRARHSGIGSMRLTPLTLSVNFRSQAGIVEWVNESFARVLPAVEDIAGGAVPYSKSVASQAAEGHCAVQVHPFLVLDSNGEAQRVAELVHQTRQSQPGGTVAILVRARSHLAGIALALKEQGLRYRAIEIEQLGHRPVIQDLLALTRALLHPADRIAWLAILRAPWCGLSLADLHAIASADPDAAIWDLITNEERIGQLSNDDRLRLHRMREIMRVSLTQRRRRGLRRWVEGAWLALGGPACVQNVTDLDDAQVFFDLLEQWQRGGDIDDFAAIEQQVATLYALPDIKADDTVQLMTIHKAKGLEFDTVIVPGLGRGMPADESRLLMWMERPATAREAGDLLLAPIKAHGEQEDPIYAWLKYADQQKGRHEAGRLLYVAATRAKKTLHLLGHVALSKKDGKLKKPRSDSLLNQLWDVVEKDFVAHAAENPAMTMPEEYETTAIPPPSFPKLRRLMTGWKLPPAPEPVKCAVNVAAVAPQNAKDNIEFLWASDAARHVGTVVHRILRQIAMQGPDSWGAARIAAQRPTYRTLLAQLGVGTAELGQAVQQVETALARTLKDQRGRWLLDNTHHDSRCEYALTGIIAGKPVNIIIDRTFVDQNGTRWIIDYKTSRHEGGDLDAFLDNEQLRYRSQLENYAALISRLEEGRPIRVGLYFPLLGGWREWEGTSDVSEVPRHTDGPAFFNHGK